MLEPARSMSAPLAIWHTSARGLAGVLFWSLLPALLVWTVGFLRPLDLPTRFAVAAGTAVAACGILYTGVATRRTKYRLFRDSLEVQRGLVARRIENLRLFRVRYLSLAQGAWRRA